MSKTTYTYKRHTLIDGMSIKGTINKVKVEGKLRIEGDRLYFCQNVMSGNFPFDNNLLGYKHSWAFNILGKDVLSDGVILTDFEEEDLSKYTDHKLLEKTTRKIVTEFKNDYSDLNLVEEKSIYNPERTIFYTKNNTINTLFRRQGHPDCCGCIITYNFCNSRQDRYSKYKNLTEEDYSMIKENLQQIKTPLLAHLASYQNNAKKFVEKLGFIERFNYKNPNSGNTISVYQFQND